MTRRDSLSVSLAKRVGALRFSTVKRVWGRVWRPLVWAFWLVYFGFVLAVLGLRYVVLPHIEDYRGDIERMMGAVMARIDSQPAPAAAK